MISEPSFAELGLGIRVHLANVLTDAALRWIDAPGIAVSAAAPGTEASAADAWYVASARLPGAPHKLRVVIDAALTPAAFVIAAYRAILGRAPDSEGLAHFSALLEREPDGQGALLAILANSPEASGRYETFQFTRGSAAIPTYP